MASKHVPDRRACRRRTPHKARRNRHGQRDARFRLLAEHSRDIFFSMRFPEGVFEYISPSVTELLGFQPEDFYADPAILLRCVAPHWRDTVRGWLDGIARGEAAETYEYQAQDRHGRLRWISQRQVLGPTPDGARWLLQGVATDVTDLREAQLALRESEARFRSLAENSRDIFFSYNLDAGRYGFISPNCVDVFGHPPQAFFEDPSLFLKCVAPAWRKTVADWIDENLRGIVRDSYAFEILDGQGRQRWIEERLALVPSPEGRLLQGVAQDKTEERAASRSLRESEARYRELAEGWADQVVIRINLTNGRYEYVSPGMERVFGFSPEEFYRGGRSVAGNTVAPEWRAAVQEWMAKARQGVLLPTYEYELIDAWGQRRWVDQRCTLYNGADGRPEVVQGVLFDITGRKRLEVALAASERKYRDLYESMRDGYAATDLDGRILEHNPAFREMLGYTEDEVSRLTYQDITPPRWHAEESRILREQALVRGYTDIYEKEYVRKDGIRFPVALRAQLTRDAQGEPAGFWATVRDITGQKQAEAAVLASERRFSELIRNSSDSITILDRDGIQVFASHAAERILGFAPEELVNIPVIQEMIHPEDQERVAAAFATVLNDGKAGAQYRHRHKDGSWVHLDAWGTNQLDNPDIRGVVVNARDVTARKRAEQALRESEERYRLIVETSSEGMMAIDAEMRLAYCNRVMAEMLGYREEELLRLRMPDLFFEEDLPLHRTELERRRKGLSSRFERRFRHKDGTERWAIFSGTPVMDENGAFRGAFGMLTDITERRRAEQALRQSEERYALALRGANDGIWDWDLASQQIYYSDRWKEILGFGPEELAHDPEEWTSRIHPEDYDAVMAANQACIRGLTPIFEVEYRLRHKDGSYRWILGRGAALADVSGRVVRLAGAHTDITARKEAEESLRKSERLSRKLLESMQEGVWAVDENRRTIFVNERLCAMLGYSATELTTLTLTDVLDWPQAHLARKRFELRMAGIPGATDYVLTRKDGGRFPAHILSSPIMEEQGRFEGLVCSVVDLTERARMEHGRRRNQARLEALYGLSRVSPATEDRLAAFALGEAMRLTDSEAGVLFFASADGQRLAPMAWETGSVLFAHNVPEFLIDSPAPWSEALRTGETMLLNDCSRLTAELLPPGHPPVIRLLCVPAHDGGRPVAVLALAGKQEPYTAEDSMQGALLMDGMWRVVRARRDEESIRASLKEKEALLHEVHHRVKNNLQVVSSLLDMAGRRQPSEAVRLSLSEVRAKVQAMSLIHSQLHRADNAGGVDLERFVRAMFSQLTELYAGGLSLSLRHELDGLALGLDQAVPLGLALNEALANVFKHACPQDGDGPRATRVDIRARRDDHGDVAIEIEDDGPGLPPGLDPQHAPSLGMKLIRGLVTHQLRGRLEYASADPGVVVRICFRPSIAK